MVEIKIDKMRTQVKVEQKTVADAIMDIRSLDVVRCQLLEGIKTQAAKVFKEENPDYTNTEIQRRISKIIDEILEETQVISKRVDNND